MSRRSFLVASAAVCMGCADDDDGDARDAAGEGRGGAPGGGGFGGEIGLGPLDDVLADVDAAGGFLYLPEARAYVVRADDEELGIRALYQKCPHLGCRVPVCESSARFECPCHGSVFNRVGERVEGPAPRSMDRFAIRLDDGDVVVDTTVPLEGADDGLLTVDPDPAGPVCVAAPPPDP